MTTDVTILDYGSGNIRSVQHALEHVGASVEVTNDPHQAVAANALVVPGVGAFSACMEGLRKVHGPRIIGQRLAGDRPVLGICVGMQVMFEQGVEHGITTEGCGEWPGAVTQLEAERLPHMGWNTVDFPKDSELFAGLDAGSRVYFVHSYAARTWDLVTDGRTQPPKVSWAEHDADRFVAAVENGPLWATQFHPEKSGEVGSHVLSNWLGSL